MKILLINPPIRLSQLPYFHPIGLAVVANVLKNAGNEVEILDLNILRCELKDIHKNLPSKSYDWIGVSGLISTFSYLKTLVPLLREKYGDTPLVLGGGGFTSAPQVYMETFNPDFGVVGEGEYTAVELFHKKPEDILGLAYWDDGLRFTSPRPLERDLNKFPLPAFDLLDMDTYSRVVKYARKSDREAAVLTTRGCPFDCNYCYHIFGRGVRYRSVERVIQELEFLKSEYGVGSILFGDECITTRKQFMAAMCQEMIDRKMNLEWICYSRVDTVDEQILPLMAKAGCHILGFGFESGSQRILNAMNKKTTTEKMLSAISLARRYIPRVSATMIFGYPGETDESIKETIDFCARAHTEPSSLFYLQPYPGTTVFNQYRDRIIEQLGSLPEFFSRLGDAGEYVVNLTDWSDIESVLKWQRTSMSLQMLAQSKYDDGVKEELKRLV